jgi:hypothetical protein
MPAVDLREIAVTSEGSGLQDTFELFTRDFLTMLGFQIEQGPDRGADAGRDLLVLECRKGVSGKTIVRWLVSCKHYAHSARSVTSADEPDLKDRLYIHGCSGFIGVYSTLPAASLSMKLKSLTEAIVFDRERIESELLKTAEGLLLFKRYFPMSFASWSNENPEPAKLLHDQAGLSCLRCRKSLLTPPSGIMVVWKSRQGGSWANAKREVVYWCCKGECDRILREYYRNPGWVDGWQDITSLIIPTIYLKWTIGFANQLQNGIIYSDDAYTSMKEILIEIFPYVARQLTLPEREHIEELVKLPSFLGGFA